MMSGRAFVENRDRSVIKNFFHGNFPPLSPSTLERHPEGERETLSLILDSIDRFMSPQSDLFRQFDEQGYQSEEYIDELRALGLFGLIIPEQYDGLGLSSRAYARVLNEVSRFDGSTALTIGAHSSIGLKALLLFGNDAQKALYLPKLATGEYIAAFCLTESQAGSDAASLRTRAIRQKDGGWLLNGEKIWITNGPLAQFFTVFARTDEDSSSAAISAFIVERSYTGVSIGPKEDKMGIRASATSSVAFQNVYLPPSALIGNEGQGFKIAVAVLNSGRTGLGGGCVGAMKRCLEHSTQHARERKQFGSAIGSYQLIQEKITRMNALCFATESMVQMVGQLIDHDNEDYSLEAAATKVFASEALWEVAFESLQIAGGNGFMKEFPYELVTRDSRINLIFEGTNEILRLYIGLKCFESVGKYLKDIQESLSNLKSTPNKHHLKVLKYVLKNILTYPPLNNEKSLQSLARQLNPNDAYNNIHPLLRDHVSSLIALTSNLNRKAEKLARKYKGDIKLQQLAVASLSDTAINLYAAYCVLARSLHFDSQSTTLLSLSLATLTLLTEHAKKNLDKRHIDVGQIGPELLNNNYYPWDVVMK
jgi:alkylation response protein AidB-like acyl-CoA dehydrogenase